MYLPTATSGASMSFAVFPSSAVRIDSAKVFSIPSASSLSRFLLRGAEFGGEGFAEFLDLVGERDAAEGLHALQQGEIALATRLTALDLHEQLLQPVKLLLIVAVAFLRAAFASVFSSVLSWFEQLFGVTRASGNHPAQQD